MKLYTRGGDKGATGLFGGDRVSKSHPRLMAYGTLDELNSAVGLLRLHAQAADEVTLQRIQHDLNTAVVFITHDLGVIARVASRVQVMYAGRAVERATVDDLFAHPAHPYTSGLMASLPGRVGTRLTPILGAPPNMLAPPSGCAFRARCVHSADVCAADPPPELVAFGSQETACVRIHELSQVTS